jgi:hypothetical protein
MSKRIQMSLFDDNSSAENKPEPQQPEDHPELPFPPTKDGIQQWVAEMYAPLITERERNKELNEKKSVCKMCGEEFTHLRSQEEMAIEADELWGMKDPQKEFADGNAVVVCDGCFKTFMNKFN